MRKADPTFHLIKSLTKREKDLFVRYAGLEGQGSKSRKYVDLFRAFGKQKVYDEKALKDQFKGEGFTNNFAEAKRGLREIILRVLVYSIENTEKELQFHLLEADQLLQRGEADLSLQLIQKSRAIAEAEERFSFSVRFIDLEKRWLLLHGDPETMGKSLLKLEDQKKSMRASEAALETLRDLHDNYQPLLKASYAMRGEMDTAIQQELERNNLMSAAPVQGVRMRFFHLRLRLVIALTTGQFEEGLKLAQDISILYRSSPYLLADYPEEHLKLQSNICRLTLLSGNHKAAAKKLEAFKAIEVHTPYMEYLKAEHYYINILDLCLVSGDLKPGFQYMPEIETFLNEEGDRIRTSRKFHFYNWIGRFYFQAGDIKAAARWFQKALDHPPTRLRTDLQIVNRVLLLLAYHELGESELMESLRRSTDRYIGDIRDQRPAEKRILSFLNSKYSDPSGPGYRKAVLELYEDLQKLIEGNSGRALREYYGVLQWLGEKKK
jgi:tetratricopeptide (TPR) repeat protein